MKNPKDMTAEELAEALKPFKEKYGALDTMTEEDWKAYQPLAEEAIGRQLRTFKKRYTSPRRSNVCVCQAHRRLRK